MPIVYKRTRLSNYVGNPFGFVDTQSYLNIMKSSRILRQIPKRFNSTATTRANSLPSHDHILHNSAAQSAAPLKNAITKTLFNKDSTTITFNTKGSENLVISFNNLFLRDSSRSARSIEASSGQKLFTTGELLLSPNATIPKSVEITPDSKAVHIEWCDGDAYSYPLDFLLEYSGISSKVKTSSKHRQVLWDKKLLKSNIQDLLSIDYHSFMDSSDHKLYQSLVNLQKFGISFITNVPQEVTTGYDSWFVKLIAEKIGHVRPTFYGEVFDVINKPNADNIAYTSVKLPLHMDLLYLENVPGWQLLHAIKNSSDSGSHGMNLFVDSFNAARYVREVDADAYEALTQVPINYHYERDDKRYLQARPLITEYDIHEGNNLSSTYSELIKEVNYSPPFQAPFDFGIWDKPKGYDVTTLPSKLTQRLLFKDFTRGLALFEKFIRTPENQFRLKLPENTCVIFNNRRLLHARTGFDGERWLKGCYVDNDTIKSKLRYLEERFA